MLSEEERTTIIGLYLTGKIPSQIFKQLKCDGYSRTTIYRVIKKFKESSSTEFRKKLKKKRPIRTQALVKKVREAIRRNPQRSLRKMALQLKISYSTVRRVLNEDLKMKAFKKTTTPLLSATQKRNRVIRCKQLLRRHDIRNISHVLFSDEKIFTIEEAHNPQNVRIYAPDRQSIPRSKKQVFRTQHPASVMVWAGVSCQGKTNLIFIPQGTKVNAAVYKNTILEAEVKELGSRMFGNEHWVFQQDSAPSHKAKSTQQWLSENVPAFISTSEWPATSPDLNPLDYFVWGRLQGAVNNKRHKSLEELKRSLKREWGKLSMEETCQACKAFLPRLRLCIKKKGGYFEKFEK